MGSTNEKSAITKYNMDPLVATGRYFYLAYSISADCDSYSLRFLFTSIASFLDF